MIPAITVPGIVLTQTQDLPPLAILVYADDILEVEVLDFTGTTPD